MAARVIECAVRASKPWGQNMLSSVLEIAHIYKTLSEAKRGARKGSSWQATGLFTVIVLLYLLYADFISSKKL